MASDENDRFEFNEDVYSQIVELITSHPEMNRLLQDLQYNNKRYVNLVCEDWKDRFENSEIFKKWKNAVKFYQNPTEKKNCKCYRVIQNHQAFLIVAGNFIFNRENKYATEIKSNNFVRCECFNSGPIHVLTEVLQKQMNKIGFSYINLFIPKCGNMEQCSQCQRYQIQPGESTFCTKYVTNFDGKDITLVTSSYIKEYQSNISFIGFALIEVNGVVCFLNNTSIKLSGNIKKLIYTNESCLLPEIDDPLTRVRRAEEFTQKVEDYQPTFQALPIHLSPFIPEIQAKKAKMSIHEVPENEE